MLDAKKTIRTLEHLSTIRYIHAKSLFLDVEQTVLSGKKYYPQYVDNLFKLIVSEFSSSLNLYNMAEFFDAKYCGGTTLLYMDRIYDDE